MIFGNTTALGPIMPTDLGQLIMWSDDPAIARVNEPYVPKNCAREADFWLNATGDPTRVFFAIRQTHAPEIIGHVQITEIHAIHRSAVMGILVGDRKNRGKGFGTDAMCLAIEYCWHHLNLRRLTLSAFATNRAAIDLYQRLGFEIEGLLRSAQFIDGHWTDLCLLALMRPDK